MSSQRLHGAGDAFRRGDHAELVELVDSDLIDAAETPEAADRLRFVRALALVYSGNPQGALVTLGAIEPARQATNAVLRLTIAACLAVDAHDRARKALAQLIKSGDREMISTYQAVQVRRGLDAVAAGDDRAALDALRAAQIQHIHDIATRFAAWLGLLTAAERANDRAAIIHAFGLFPEWARDRRANLICARSAIAALDTAAATRHLEVLRGHPDAVPLWWSLCTALFAAPRYRELVELFATRRTDLPEECANSILVVVAFALHGLNRHADSQHAIEQLAVRCPDDALIAHAAAFLSFAAGNVARAEKHLRRVPADSEPAMLLRWALAFSRERYEPIRDALNPEAVRAWPEGPERETACLIASLANVLLGGPSRAWALLRTAGDPKRPTASPTTRYLSGYLALIDRDYSLAASLLGGSPLGVVARIERARELADTGSWTAALAELTPASGRGLDAMVIDTRNLIRLQQAQEAMRADDMDAAVALLAQVRTEAPHLAERVAAIEDYATVRATLKSLKTADPGRVSEVLWELYGATPADASEQQQSARRRDLAYLAGVMELRSLVRPGDRRGSVPRIIEAFEASLDEDPRFPPAAVLLGLVLQHRGDKRALELLDIAHQGQLSTPAIQGALALEYVRDGRLVEAKRIFLDQLAGKLDNSVANAGLRQILAQDAARILRAAGAPALESPVPALPKAALEAPDLPLSIDPFAGTDERARLLMLIHHVEAGTRLAPPARRAGLAGIARELKHISVQGALSGLAVLEKRALALLQGAEA